MSAPQHLCPYLGLVTDVESVHSSASQEHRCYATIDPQAIALEYQQHYCLTVAHPQCPLFQRAQPQGAAPRKTRFDPALVAPLEAMQAEAPAGPAARPITWLDRIIVGVAVAAVLFAIGYFGALFLNLPANNQRAALAPTSTPTAATTVTPTRVSTPRATAAVAATPALRAAPTAPPNGRLFSLLASAEGAGWVVSNERPGNHMGEPLIQAGVFNKGVYLGLVQFDLAQIPAGTKAIYAALDLIGSRDEQLHGEGTWQVKVVNLPAGRKLSDLTFEDARDLPVDFILPLLTPDQLGKGKINHFEFSAPLLSALERRFGSGRLTLRIEGPTGGDDNLFAWESGLSGSSQQVRSILYVGTAQPEAPLSVIPCVPTPSDPAQRAQLAATATYIATVFGTATPYPPNYVTVVPVTATPSPESVFVEATRIARATEQATLVGSATPTPVNWVVPLIVQPTPVPRNEATAAYQAAEATVAALKNGTPTPLPCYAQIATVTPAPPVIFALPSATPTVRPTATPTDVPAILHGLIAFFSDRGGSPSLYVMSADGSQVGLLTQVWPYTFAMQKQLVTGQFRLAVLGDLRLGTKIALFDHNDLLQRMLYDSGAISYDPAFAPDGYNLVFVSTDSGHDELYHINRDGGGFARITQSTWEWNKKPSWSPDGRQIVWWSNRDSGRKQIWIMNADGTQQTNLSNNSFNDWDPVWIH